jgi:hypothetical protein
MKGAERNEISKSRESGNASINSGKIVTGAIELGGGRFQGIIEACTRVKPTVLSRLKERGWSKMADPPVWEKDDREKADILAGQNNSADHCRAASLLEQ